MQRIQLALLTCHLLRQGGPTPRSCHTMCYDPTRKSIYVLGRYKEYRLTASPDVAAYESEFFQYFIELDRWVRISGSTQVCNKIKIQKKFLLFYS